MLAAFGNMRLVALCVNVKAPVNLMVLSTPDATVPNAVIVVVPVTSTKSPLAMLKSTVAAEAISAPFLPMVEGVEILVGVKIEMATFVKLAVKLPESVVTVTLVSGAE